MSEHYPNIQITIKASNIILDESLPNFLLTTEIEETLYLVTPTGLQQYTYRDKIIPFDEIQIQAKFKTSIEKL